MQRLMSLTSDLTLNRDFGHHDRPTERLRYMWMFLGAVWVQWALVTPRLFAANNESNGNGNSSGLMAAIIGVVVPTLLVIVLGGAIYIWLRRNKRSLTRYLPRQRTPANRRVSPYTSRPPFQSPIPTRRPSRPVERVPEQDSPPEPDADSLESLSLKELEEVVLLREAGRIQDYYESIAMVIKRYVGEKYQIKILDATTGQILEALPDNLTDTVADHVGEILRTCDMIHFSRHRPSRSELAGIYQTAKEFIESQITPTSAEMDELDEDSEEDSEIHEYYRRMMS